MRGPRAHRYLAAIGLLLGSLLVGPCALAQQSPYLSSVQGAVNETATIGSFTGGQSFSDAFGNTLSVGSIYTGQISGAPITGSFRFDGDFQRPAGSAAGEFHGTFVASDGAGNSMYGVSEGSEV